MEYPSNTFCLSIDQWGQSPAKQEFRNQLRCLLLSADAVTTAITATADAINALLTSI
jgi:hypothetical protein